MLIVDSQVHIWNAGKASAHHDNPVLPQPFTTQDLLGQMDAAGVHRVILAPPGWDPNGDAYSLEAARLHPDRFAVVGALPANKDEAAGREAIRHCRSVNGVLGLRFLFNSPQTQARLRDGSTDWIWDAAEREQVPVMLLAPGALPEVAGIAERHPGLRMVLDHLAIPRGAKDEAAFAHLPELCRLARFPNLAVKAGGIPGYSSREGYPWPSLHKHVRQVFDAFGPRRMQWATDLTRMHCSYRECVTMFTEQLPWLAGQDLELVMGRAVCEWLDWSLPDRA